MNSRGAVKHTPRPARIAEPTISPDSLLEEDGFELPVPSKSKTGGFSEQASSTPPAGKTSRNRGIRPERDRWFESVFLQRGVRCELRFSGGKRGKVRKGRSRR